MTAQQAAPEAGPAKRGGDVMPWHVWFVPAQPNHVAKFKPLMDDLRRRGCETHVLCVDEAIPERKHIRHLLEKEGWDFEVLDCGGFIASGRWQLDMIQDRRLRRRVSAWVGSRDVDLLILGTDSPIITREIIKEARDRHIPRVHLHDGLCLGLSPRFRPGPLHRVRIAVSNFLRRAFDQFPPRGQRSADLFFVMDASSPDTLIKGGVPAERIKVVGSPQLDAMVRQADEPVDEETLQRIRSRIAAAPDRPILLYAHQHIVYPQSTTKRLIRGMIAGLRRTGGSTLLVKFHPSSGEVVAEWQEWARRKGFGSEEIVFVLEGLLSVEAVQVCHACMTAYSTVALEAMILRKPVVLAQYLPGPHFINWGEKYGAMYDVFSDEELETAVFEVMSDDQVRERLLRRADECLRQEFGGLDGNSAERIGDYLIGLIREYQGAS